MPRSQLIRSAELACAALTLAIACGQANAQSAPQKASGVSTLASTVPANGDVNPYAIVVAPATSGKLQKGDVLIDNFNNKSNLQGTGTTIVDYNPSTKKMSLFADLASAATQCPGGIGLSTAMTVLKSGWVIVGSTPSKDGTTSTKGPGCLLVLNTTGDLKAVWTGPKINDPWGNMAVVDKGARAALFISMSGFDVPGPDKMDPSTKQSVVTRKATIVRIDLTVPAGGAPKIKDETIVADGFGEQADKGVFLIGPTGLALVGSTLYASDAIDNRIVAIAEATTRKTSAGTGRVVTKAGDLQRPLALAPLKNGDILAANGLNGQVVEFDPKSGKQLEARWVNVDQAQSPPGSGDLFGLVADPRGGFYFVEDDTNFLAKAQ